METLGPLATLEVGEAAELIERWELAGPIGPFDLADESAIEAAVGRHLAPTD